MEAFRIQGGDRLKGTVSVPGAKNSVLKLMAAALLAEGTTVLRNVPEILDVRIMCELLRRLGCGIDYDPAAGRVAIDVPAEIGHRADYELVRAMRASICVLGPLTTRLGAAHVALPGGDAIGSRGLDMHQAGLEALGATVRLDHGYFIAEAPEGLRGTEVRLEFPSVGATENLLMAATLARGTTVIDNVAREPEIVDLCTMLARMGARIEGIGSSTLSVTGVERLSAVEHRVVGDRIVAGTWAFAAAVTGGDVTVEGVDPAIMTTVLEKLELAGCRISTGEGETFRVEGPERPHAIRVATLPYPGFPTDLQPFVVTLNAVSDGLGMLTENLFEARWRFVRELARLGAQVSIDGRHAVITGVGELSGAPVEASDIRAGAALVIAGIVASGITEVTGVDHIDRGYERFAERLRALGARIERVAYEQRSLEELADLADGGGREGTSS
ncbi:UDP-N-acetylglucosamine 1-carboxyvinyltransferase [Sediminivirga luteola]|uniref:UDP-N-acetylglucosamine 1-carboxyvinyltransferase n=1 Tax=Sediminivirga luteola TaxID=1774748 RepID=A0A8J2TWC2_9MICO|nr:UDP-N-acetylglucosamine 1-carboxyvinyltransferase [Sediminivirga luteola]MCI2266553.1 UDP-N-acetylglucosamine 1-carboxyvinyltransferase [Sediminivirga luteola]GGA07841.1 UDP-N-acetylglucosamine 1-carboxyvinyltransferase [Sediminivirga luteola]